MVTECGNGMQSPVRCRCDVVRKHIQVGMLHSCDSWHLGSTYTMADTHNPFVRCASV